MKNEIFILSHSVENFHDALNQILKFAHQSFISNQNFHFSSEEAEQLRNQIQKIQHQLCFLKDVSFDLKESLAALHYQFFRRFYLN